MSFSWEDNSHLTKLFKDCAYVGGRNPGDLFLAPLVAAGVFGRHFVAQKPSPSSPSDWIAYRDPGTWEDPILDEEGNPVAFEPALREIVASHPEVDYITVGHVTGGAPLASGVTLTRDAFELLSLSQKHAFASAGGRICRASDVSAEDAPSTVCAEAPGREPRASFARALLRRITGR